MRNVVCLLFLIALGIPAFGQSTAGDAEGINRDPEKAEIVTSDIGLFWSAYDRATPEDDLIVFRNEYLRKGSPGLKEFTRLRIGSVCDLAATIGARPRYYRNLREGSLRIASFEPSIRKSFVKLKELYPEAVFPPVYFVIGRMSSAGTLSEKGLLIGVDMFGRTADMPEDELSDWHKAVLSSVDRIPYIVAHELIHYQQAPPASRTLLAVSVREGAADFVGELISGGQINPHLHEYGNPREAELWAAFSKEMDGEDLSNWLYQGERAKDAPADLGYYIGYKIAESYYIRAADKKLAVFEILKAKDFKAFLEKSGYAEKFAGGAS